MTSGPNQFPNPADPDIHLQRLLAIEIEEPWYRSFIKNIKELIRPPKLPPLEITSKPVEVKDIWGFYGGQEKKAGLSSLAIHAGVIGLLFLIGLNPAVRKAVQEHIALIAPHIAPYKPTPAKQMGGG